MTATDAVGSVEPPRPRRGEHMSATSLKRLAWALASSSLVLTVGALAISLTSGASFTIGNALFIWAITVVFTVTGLLIATRQPGNAIAWLFLGVGGSAALGDLAGAYAQRWVDVGAGSELLGQTAAWYGGLSWMPFILVPATFLLLLFPDGHLLSARWRAVAWCAGVGIIGTFVTTGMSPGPLEDYPTIDNPYGVDSVSVQALEGIAALGVVIGVVGSAASIVVRFRRARGDQREQMKWIALAGGVAAVTIPVMTALYEVVGESVANVTMMLSIMGLPVATAVAIRRYRLYDIDLVINRALVYGSLTATLAAFYVGCVLLLQLGLSSLTRGSGLAVAVSTLAVAGLFRPVRARIQRAVDQRFFRQRYDAARTIEAFGARLRDEVDLSELSVDLQAVIMETMRPAHLSLWLRGDEASR